MNGCELKEKECGFSRQPKVYSGNSEETSENRTKGYTKIEDILMSVLIYERIQYLVDLDIFRVLKICVSTKR